MPSAFLLSPCLFLLYFYLKNSIHISLLPITLSKCHLHSHFQPRYVRFAFPMALTGCSEDRAQPGEDFLLSSLLSQPSLSRVEILICCSNSRTSGWDLSKHLPPEKAIFFYLTSKSREIANGSITTINKGERGTTVFLGLSHRLQSDF